MGKRKMNVSDKEMLNKGDVEDVTGKSELRQFE